MFPFLITEPKQSERHRGPAMRACGVWFASAGLSGNFRAVEMDSMRNLYRPFRKFMATAAVFAMLFAYNAFASNATDGKRAANEQAEIFRKAAKTIAPSVVNVTALGKVNSPGGIATDELGLPF